MRVLTSEEYNQIKVTFRDDSNFEFDLNALILTEENSNLLKSLVLDIALTTKLYSLFTEAGFALMVSKVFENTYLRDYILGLTDRFSCNTAYLQIPNGRYPIEYTVATGIASNYSIMNKFNVTPDKIVGNISVDFDMVYEVLKQNKWLLTIILIVLFIEQIEVVETKTK